MASLRTLHTRASALLRAMRSNSINFYDGLRTTNLQGFILAAIKAATTENNRLQTNVDALIRDGMDALENGEEPPIENPDDYEEVAKMVDRATKAYVSAMQQAATLSRAQNKLKKLGQGGSFSRQSENFRSVPQLAIDELLEAKARTQKALKLVVGEPSGAGQAVPALNQAVKSLNDAGNILYKLAGK